jgi:hypothetical protein
MNKMKKLIAALLVMTMVLALAGTAMASCRIKAGDCVRFTKNTTAYNHRGGRATNTIVRKGSYALVKRVCNDWVELYLDPLDSCITRWFKTDNLVVDSKGKKIADDTYFYIYVIYSRGGVGKSSELYVFEDADSVDENDTDNVRISPDCYQHVKATAKVWLHYTPSLSDSFGKALRKDQKVNYRRRYSFDDRGVMFYGVWKSGKCLWVSSLYTKLVKG